jgi:ABC-type branched-subunit amino acid transport system ATPase component/ABC-type branched-subunit amino acid transport system permease subunit
MRRPSLVGAIAVALACLTILVGDSSTQSLLTLVLVYAVIGLGWNIIGGYAGQTSFGHALFVGIGAYTVVLLQRDAGVSPLLGVWAAMALAVLAALLVGWPTFRLSGVYFSLATLVYPLMAIPLLAWLGFQEVSVPYRTSNGALYLQFVDPRWLTACALGLLIVAALISAAVQSSRFGAALVAIREEPVAAAAAGIDVRKRKLQAYCLSAAMTAAAGALYASVLLVVTPDSVFGLLVSVQALILPLVGGRGSVWGPILGSVLLTTLSEELTGRLGAVLPGINGLLFGVALVLVVVFAREGILWRVRDLVSRRYPPAARRAPHSADGEAASQPAHGPMLPASTELEPVELAPVLSVSGLKKAFSGVQVLESVSFDVGRGEIVGIIGPNGAGKTTLLNIINGLVPGDGGSVLLAGEDVTGWAPHALCARGVARTFQVARPLPRCDVLENVRIAALSFRDGDNRAWQALRTVGLEARASASVDSLAVGELRRLELARALAGQPDLLLVDEILAGMSPAEVAQMVLLLRAVASRGTAVLIIEHTIGAMLHLADRLVVLNVGSVITSGAARDVIKDRRVIDAYLGSKWAAHA